MEERGAKVNYRWYGCPVDQTERQGDVRFDSRNQLFIPIIFGLYGGTEGGHTLARDCQ